jgi:serpin B
MRTSIVFALIAGGCAGDASVDVIAERQLPAELQADASAIARSNNQFACDVYKATATTGNVFLSPFSISTAFAMVDAGAAGTTDAELRTALHLDLPGERAHAAIGAMLTSLDRGASHGAYTLATANRLFGQTGFPFEPSFLAITKRDYLAELQPLDFQDAPDASRADVNAWVAKQTANKIPELFGADAITSQTRLALANAILFKGTWQTQFKTSDTTAADFHLAGGATVQVAMMHRTSTEPVELGAIPGALIAKLPFAGKDLSLLVVLPDDAAGLPALEAQLSASAITQWLSKIHIEATPLALPKFELSTSLALTPTLQQLGVSSVFDPDLADLSGIDGRHDLYVERALHKAVISVDEHGAEAAGATGVVVVPDSLPPAFVADHPFLFMIYDHVTEAVLFIGRVADPTRS